MLTNTIASINMAASDTVILAAAGDTLPARILTTAVAWVAPIGALILVIFIIKDIIGIVKGREDASVGKVVVKIIIVFFLIGVMFAALNYEALGQMFSNVFGNVVREDNLPDLG